MTPLKVAVIGCGFFGSMHAEIYSKMNGVELTAVVDVSLSRAKELAARLGTEGFDDADAVIERDDIDIVDVCVPDSLHTGVVLKALSCKKHILIEKPLADTLENAEAILKAAENYPKKLMVAHICRFDIRYVKAFEAIQNGDLGEIIYIASKRNSPTLGAHRYAKQCKLITHSGVHDMDLIRWFMGCEYKSVYAVGRKVRMVKEGYEDALDSIQAVYTFENGVTYSLENTWALPDKYPSYIDATINIVGTKGQIQIDMGNQGYNIYTNDDCIIDDVSYWPEALGVRLGDLRAELEHFVDCVANDKPPRCSLRDGYEVAYAAVKTLESIDRGEIVQIR